MPKLLHLSPTLSLPTDLGTETIAILGRRGSGKSNTATVLTEELLDAGGQIVLIDPKGEGWGLKAHGTGPDATAGKDVIAFGDPEGDLPLREEHADTLADFVVSSGRSAVLSLSGFDADAAARRFVARFCERLFTLKKKPENHSPLTVILEEAHLFVPQRVEGAQADVVSRVQRLVRQGRSMGIGVILVDQRPASVNKDVLTQIEIMVCHQLTSPHDRKAVDAWIEANAEASDAAEFRRTLPALNPGEAWVWSPAKLKLFQRVAVRRRSTFDSGSTPILGKGGGKRPAMREVDLGKLRQQLEKVVEEKKANDPAALKARIRELEKEVAAPAAKAEVKRVEVPVLSEKNLKRLEELHDRAEKRHERVYARLVELINPFLEVSREERAEIANLRQTIQAAHGAAARLHAPAVTTSPAANIAHAVPLTARPTPRLPQPARLSGKRTPQQRILDAVAWWNSIGVPAPSRAQVGFVAGIKPTGGHFANTIGPLSTGGLIAYSGDGVTLTDAGRADAIAPAELVGLDGYHGQIRDVLRSGVTQAIFNAIASAKGKSVTTADVGAAVGINPEGGHFANSIGPLGTLGLITRKSGVITPTKLMFPEGLS